VTNLERARSELDAAKALTQRSWESSGQELIDLQRLIAAALARADEAIMAELRLPSGDHAAARDLSAEVEAIDEDLPDARSN
jgi:hypothetical protein